MTATVTELHPSATPDTPPAPDFTAHAEFLVRTFGYTPAQVPDLCPRATEQVQEALALAMAAVSGESARLILGTAP